MNQQLVEINQQKDSQNLLKYQAVDKIFQKIRVATIGLDRARNRLDIISPFTYHTQAFATGLTAAAMIKCRGN